MPNAKDYVRQKALKFLIVGPPGSGKTTLAMTVPGKKFAYLFDPNSLESLSGADIDYEYYPPDEVPIQAMPLARDKQPTPSRKTETWKPTAYKKFENSYYKRISDKGFDEYDVVIIDSYTSLVNIMMDEIMFLNKRPSRRPMIDDYGAVVQGMENLFRDLIPRVGILYVTAHSFLEKDELTGAMMWVKQMTKGQAKNIPLLFTDIWAAEAGRNTKGGGSYSVLTIPDRRHPWIRSSFRGAIAAEEDVIIEDWKRPEIYGIGKLMKKAVTAK